MTIKVHENTVEKVKNIIKEEGKEGLRIETCGASCGGTNFKIFPDNINAEKDYIITDENGIKIIMEKNISNMFSEAVIEYKKTILGWEFKIY
ncbi:MAG: iron-sulfur cluster biosynthesis family protein [Clostridium perfringens]|nr:iron-sulfur cluster biosynthesis family protein [Clostridium perfringens]